MSDISNKNKSAYVVDIIEAGLKEFHMKKREFEDTKLLFTDEGIHFMCK